MTENTNKVIFRKDENGKQKQNKYKTNGKLWSWLYWIPWTRKQQNSRKTSRKISEQSIHKKFYLKY